jgi:membrane-associated phospholipid phosphatase
MVVAESDSERRTRRPLTRTLLASVAAAVFVAVHVAGGDLKVTHVLFAVVTVAAVFMLDRWRAAVLFALPFIVMTAAYDLQRFVGAKVTSMPVHVTALRTWELAWFGIHTPHGEVTPAAWFQTHSLAVLDVVSALTYLGFVAAFLVMAVWWRFKERRPEAQRVMWALLWLHLTGYLVHLLYPTAPPWYVDVYGDGPAVADAAPDPAGLARFDDLFDTSWFANQYSTSSNTFGACPSLHVGQMFLAVLFALRFRSLRTVAVTYWALVLFASVYLNHHYIVDGLVGMVFAVGAYVLVHLPERLRR